MSCDNLCTYDTKHIIMVHVKTPHLINSVILFIVIIGTSFMTGVYMEYVHGCMCTVPWWHAYMWVNESALYNVHYSHCWWMLNGALSFTTIHFVALYIYILTLLADLSYSTQDFAKYIYYCPQFSVTFDLLIKDTIVFCCTSF